MNYMKAFRINKKQVSSVRLWYLRR